jgi:hypothetical protein
MFPSFFNFAPLRLTRQEEKKGKISRRDVKSFHLKNHPSLYTLTIFPAHPRKHLQNKLPKDSQKKESRCEGEKLEVNGERIY